MTQPFYSPRTGPDPSYVVYNVPELVTRAVQLYGHSRRHDGGSPTL